MQLELNVDTAIAIMSDFKNTQDWFYSMRWIPPRKFKHRLLGKTYTAKMEALYKAQHALSPSSEICMRDSIDLPPKEYRRRFSEIMQEVTSAVRNPSAHIPNTKYFPRAKQDDRSPFEEYQ